MVKLGLNADVGVVAMSNIFPLMLNRMPYEQKILFYAVETFCKNTYGPTELDKIAIILE